ncbi:uncharacterized protein MONBRDRAFT_23437 [Monosiga brevicollis MX1]|uniref:U2 snRNP-associated SURP motif-containing protein n=1 Tax=Monosiga brevicollis TaxID=81824 RepID=A9UTE3_MONBE|nr:uncharacterized protein MONBRDRAFT_23437 [Monosiga brevicollis MX1]EDQ91233.1 predicted protein [Monosiga brevicollis MX1]|eukprot:XP_001743655.1 hypothetical protein [Monosiga brevicollis MX1]
MPWSSGAKPPKKAEAVKAFAFKARNPFEEKKRAEEARRKRDQEEAAACFADFFAEFADDEPKKGFVRGGVVNDDIFGEDIEEENKPKRKKPKSNMEIFREKLKREQERREARNEARRDDGNVDLRASDSLARSLDATTPTESETTNLYVNNLPTTFKEDLLAQLFGVHGPLASVKIMWPRHPSEVRDNLCGFVAFMRRADAQRALEKLNGALVEGHDIKTGWAKAVPIPPKPYYIQPEAVKEDYGLPFNAQPLKPPPSGRIDEEERAYHTRHSVVRVQTPADPAVRQLIHRVIEYVINHGPHFETLLIQSIERDPQLAFLTAFKSPNHVYYRWKLFSLLQGEDPDSWKETKFRMYEDGPWWIPPGMDKTGTSSRSHLTPSERDELENRLQNMTTERRDIGDTMWFCMMHSEAFQEIVDAIEESLTMLETPISLKVARLFLISDILHNSTAKVKKAGFFRLQLQSKLENIFYHLHLAYRAITGRLRAEQFRKHVISCLNVWQQWTIYPRDFLDGLHKIFHEGREDQASNADAGTGPAQDPKIVEEDVDGVPLEDEDEDVDGVPMEEDDDDDGVDGKPLEEEDDDDDDVDGQPLEEE